MDVYKKPRERTILTYFPDQFFSVVHRENSSAINVFDKENGFTDTHSINIALYKSN